MKPTPLSDFDFQTLIRLVHLYPAINQTLPLAIDAHKQQTVPLHPRLFKFALKLHTRRLCYIVMVSAKRASRHNLNGERVGWVSRVHRLHAQKRLRDMQRAQGQLKVKRSTPVRQLTRAPSKQPMIIFKRRRSVSVAAHG